MYMCICTSSCLLLDTLTPQPPLQQLLSAPASQGQWCGNRKRREIKVMWLMLCAPPALLLCPEQGPALGIPCARFIAHFVSGLHFNPTLHSPGVLSLQQAKDRTPFPVLPHSSMPIPRTQSPAGCWLERAAGLTHHRCSLWG